ncbi:Uncharacterized protein PBTT_04006 [Plasmodiophora brassicae]
MDPVDGGAAQDASRTNVSAARAVFAGLAAASSAPTLTGKPKIVTVDAVPDDDDDNVGSTAARGSGGPITRTPRPAHDASAAFSFTKTPTMKHSASNDGSSTLSPAETPREKVLSKQSSATSDDAGRDALSTPASSSKSGPAKTLPFGKADPATPSGAGHKVSGTVVGLASSGNDDAPNSRDSTTPVADALRPNSVLAKAASFNTDSNRSSTRSNSNNGAPDGGRRGVLAAASSFNRGTTEPSSSTAPSDDTEPANSTSVLKMADPRNRTTTTESATKARVSMSVDVEQVSGSLSAPASSSSDAGSASRLRSALSATGTSGASEDSAATDTSSSSRLMKRPSKLVSDLQARINITPAMMLPGSTPRSSKASITTMNDPVPTGTSSDGTQDPSISVDQALLARPSIRAQSRRRATTSKFTTNDQSTLDEVEKQAAMRVEAHGPEQSVQPVVRTVATHPSPGHCALVVAVREAIDTLKEVTATAAPEQLSAPAALAVSKAVQMLEHAIAEHGVVSEVQVGSKQDERVVVLSAATTTSVSEVL